MMQKKAFLTLFILISALANAQKAPSDTLRNIPVVFATYCADVPGKDLAKQYGWNSEIGAGFMYKTKKNWMFTFEGSFLFGDKIKDTTIFRSLKTTTGDIIGKDGSYVSYNLYERGFKFPVFKVGKVINLKISNASINSGVFVMAGVGFMQHKLRVQDLNKTFSQIQGDYIKGYDKLTNGLLLTQNIGYMYVGKENLANFFIEIETSQAFTKNRRDFDFEAKTRLDNPRLDVLYGIKVGWMFPFYKRMANEYFYY